MKIITQDELAERLDFMRPMQPPEETSAQKTWPIPFEYGSNEKGTRISVSKARYIAAELRAEVAEAEKRELYDAFKAEQRRVGEAHKNTGAAENKWYAAMQEIAILKTQIRQLKAERKKRIRK
jgi:predicted nucleotidyltransferase component of viral defense system